MSDMSQPIQPAAGGQQPQPMGPPPTQPPSPFPPIQRKQKRFGWVALIITALVSLGIGGAVAGSGDGSTTALPAPTVTTTVTAPPVEGGSEPTTQPEPEPEPTKAPAAWNPKPKDFKIGIKVLKKECFGSAGCNITFRIVPDYVGKQSAPAKGKTEVTYEVTGGEDTITNTFEIDSDATAHYSEEESASTTSSSKKLTAKATEVTYNEFG